MQKFHVGRQSTEVIGIVLGTGWEKACAVIYLASPRGSKGKGLVLR